MTTKSNPQASTSLVLPSCVTKMMLRSTSETLSDGTHVFKFDGICHSRLDLHAFYVIAENSTWGDKIVTHKGSGEDFEWTLRQYVIKGQTSYHVEFEMFDYSSKKERDLEQRIARIVMLNKHATPAKVAKLIMAEIAK